jgi:hypothetical protein
VVEVAVTGNGIAIFFIFRGAGFITGITRSQQIRHTVVVRVIITGAVIIRRLQPRHGDLGGFFISIISGVNGLHATAAFTAEGAAAGRSHLLVATHTFPDLHLFGLLQTL